MRIKIDIFFMLALGFLVFGKYGYAGAIIEFEKDYFNGVSTYEEKKSYEFKFKNTGNKDLVIENVKTTCGCTSAETQKKVILPGESSAITGTYKASPYRETFKIDVFVISNATNEPMKRLTIGGRSYPPDVLVEPRYINVTSVLGDTIKPVIVTIKTAKKLIVKDVFLRTEKDNEVISNIFSFSKLDSSDHLLKLKLDIKPPQKIANYIEEIWVDSEMEGESIKIAVPIKLEIVEEFALIPPYIQINSVNDRKNVTIRSLLKNRKGMLFSIDSVHCFLEEIDVQYKKTSSGSYFIYTSIKDDFIPKDEVKININILKENGERSLVEFPIQPITSDLP